MVFFYALEMVEGEKNIFMEKKKPNQYQVPTQGKLPQHPALWLYLITIVQPLALVCAQPHDPFVF